VLFGALALFAARPAPAQDYTAYTALGADNGTSSPKPIFMDKNIAHAHANSGSSPGPDTVAPVITPYSDDDDDAPKPQPAPVDLKKQMDDNTAAMIERSHAAAYAREKELAGQNADRLAKWKEKSDEMRAERLNGPAAGTPPQTTVYRYDQDNGGNQNQ
jgi:hypothetical protein